MGSLPDAGNHVRGVSLAQITRAARLLHAMMVFMGHLHAVAPPPDADKDGPMCSEEEGGCMGCEDGPSLLTPFPPQ